MKYRDDYRALPAMKNENNRHSLAGTADGEIDGSFVYLTKRVRIPRADILAVKPSRDGRGITVITKHGAIRVSEDYSVLMYYLYGMDVSTPEGGTR